jgi:hypothetical protein
VQWELELELSGAGECSTCLRPRLWQIQTPSESASAAAACGLLAECQDKVVVAQLWAGETVLWVLDEDVVR